MKLNMLLNYPLGANNAPFGLNKKEIWPAIIGAIGAIAGAGIAAASSSSANETNRDIAEGVNDANKSINDTQLQYAKEQYSRERLENRFLVDQSWQREIENRTHQEQYNSPAALISRLRAAGINPFLAMQNGAGSIGASHSSINAQVGQNPHANQPNMIPMGTGAPAQAYTGFGNAFSQAAANLFQLPFLEAKRDQEWVKVLSTAPLDPETKDKLIKMKLFGDDKAQKRYDMLQQEEFMNLVNDNALKQMQLAISDETNSEKRKEWERIAERHSKEMSILTNQISRFVLENRLLEDKHYFNEHSLKLIEKEVQRIGREEELWTGDFSFRNVFELLTRIFTGSNIVSLLKLMQ